MRRGARRAPRRCRLVSAALPLPAAAGSAAGRLAEWTAWAPAGIKVSTLSERRPQHAWLSGRVRLAADALKAALREQQGKLGGLSEEEARQALRWAPHPVRPSRVQLVAYVSKWHPNLDLLAASSPLPLLVLHQGQSGEWRGTLDKLVGYHTFLQKVEDDAIVCFVDAHDVFGNDFDGHELLRRYFSFGRPVVIATEENVFPREVAAQAHDAVEWLAQLGGANGSAPSRFLNAGGIIGRGAELRRMYADVWQNMAANSPEMLMAHGDLVGHWFLHAYDQYELWRYLIRHTLAAHREELELSLALDTEQLIFGSTVLVKDNWASLLGDGVTGGVNGKHSIDVDVPLVFDAPSGLFEATGCRARFVGRPHAGPVFWHGHGPWKPAWEQLRDRLSARGCFAGGNYTWGG